MVLVLEFVLRGSKQEISRSGINMAIGITNFVGRLNITVFRNYASTNFWCVFTVQGQGKKKLARGRDGGISMDF